MKTIYNKNVGIVILLLGFYQWMGAQPSTNQNYIQTRTMTDSTGTKSLDLIQYFDGLGRPVQQVQVGFTPNKADFVAFQEYDAFGREWKNWLPVNTTGSNGNFRTIQSLKDRTDTAYGTEPARYSETVYEPSPLNRVEKQYGPGQDWQEDNNGEGHPVKIEYLTNNATYPCAYYYISGNNLVKNSNYANNQLFVTKMTDEDGKVAYEFKDKLGQVVLQRQVNGTASNTTTNHDTHYVYDDFGNLRYVLPPTLSDLATSDTSYPESNDYAKQLAYIYKYDKRNRCSEKKLPGADPVYYVYDKADRLIFSQDGEQRPGNDWTFYKYDAFNRIILTGVWKNSAKTQENLTNQYQDSLATAQPGSGAYGYTWTTLAWVPSTAVLQANYYDNSDSFLNTLNSTTKAKINYSTPPTGYDARYANSKGLLVGTLVKMLDDTSKEIACAFYYDAKGRVVQQKSTNLLGGSEVEYYAYSFTGNPTKKQKVHTATGKSDITENYTYDYDHANRPTITTYQLGSNTAITLSLLTYDELGRVKEKKLHGTKETINYT
ncbi:MAG: DUF6443 domain-containing protein, partial [Candidatus Symbiothrix sp.]|nr:DUF6443 domain-containing protein [Candidatus Symbiothrix sp.]